jgi:SAM-dependent methyltransferase
MSSQQELYETIHEEYRRHLYDDTSNAYRDEFINAAMFDGLDLSNSDVAELMCGIGQATNYVQGRFVGVRCSGYDISRSACADFTRATGCPATACDLLAEPLPRDRFDAIVVVGGLHHLAGSHAKLVANIHAALREGGTFVMMEPNADYALESIRKIWYRKDRFFDADSEQALRYHALYDKHSSYFEQRRLTYLGGPAYFLILMSLVLRIPLWAKPVIAPPLMLLERAWNLIPVRQAHAIFVAQWVKKATSS